MTPHHCDGLKQHTVPNVSAMLFKVDNIIILIFQTHKRSKIITFLRLREDQQKSFQETSSLFKFYEKTSVQWIILCTKRFLLKSYKKLVNILLLTDFIVESIIIGFSVVLHCFFFF